MTTLARQVRWLALFMVVVVLLAGWVGLRRGAREVHEEGDGPLRTGLGGTGGFALDPPEGGRSRWQGSFGTMLLCTDGGPAAHLTAVRPHERVPAQGVTTTIRVVPTLGGEETPAWAPVLARLGTPHDFTDPPHVAEGRYSSDPTAVDVPTDCAFHRFDDYTELILVMTADTGGAWVDYLDIDYTRGGRDYTLRVRYDFVACGTRVPARFCVS